MANDFDFLAKFTPQQIANLLADETDSTISAALKSLPRELNTSVFLKLPVERRNEIAAVMATAKIAGSLLDILSGEIAMGLKEKAKELHLLPREQAVKTPPINHQLSAMLANLSPELQQRLAPPSTTTKSPSAITKPVEPLRRENAIKQILNRKNKITPVPLPPKNFVKSSLNHPHILQEEIAQARKMAALGQVQKIDGLALAASIVRFANSKVQQNLLDEIPELYHALRKRMFVFADLESSSAKVLAVVFSGVAVETTALALRFASENLHRRVMTAVSERRRQLIIDEIAHAGQRIRLTAIEQAQQAVIDYAIALQNQGKIVIDPHEELV